MSKDLFEDIELKTPSNTDVGVKDVIQDDRPHHTDPDWDKYVMSHFQDNEKMDGRPLVAGLRRVTEVLIGKIVFSGPTQVWPPLDDKSIRSTVIWTTTFEDGSSFSDVADVWEGNTDDMFCAFSTATAATRAEARSLRKALRIRSVAAEEMTKKDTAAIIKNISKANGLQSTEGEYEDQSRMTDAQSNFIDVKSKQLNVDVEKLFQNVFSISVKRKVTKSQASNAIKKLNEYQQKSGTCPDEILGYHEDWRS